MTQGLVPRQFVEACLRHIEERERDEHPHKRIITMQPEEDCELRVTTTDAKLARTLGTVLHRAYRGKLEQPRPDDQGPVRIRWSRE